MPSIAGSQSSEAARERRTLGTALALNAAMFGIGMAGGIWAQSSGVIADALDMLADASAYALSLFATGRTAAFKRMAARWCGVLLLALGAGVLIDVGRRWLFGSEPVGVVMAAFSALSLAVNLFVLRMLARYRHGEVHLRASWIETRADVVANIGVFISGAIVQFTHSRYPDLIIGLAIGLYVIKESFEVFGEAAHPQR